MILLIRPQGQGLSASSVSADETPLTAEQSVPFCDPRLIRQFLPSSEQGQEIIGRLFNAIITSWASCHPCVFLLCPDADAVAPAVCAFA